MRNHNAAGNKSPATNEEQAGRSGDRVNSGDTSGHENARPRGNADARMGGCAGCGTPPEELSEGQRRNNIDCGRYGIPEETREHLAYALFRAPVDAERAVVMADLRGEWPAEWSLGLSDDFERASERRRRANGGTLIGDGGRVKTHNIPGVHASDLTQFQITLLAVLYDDPKYGLALKDGLEAYSGGRESNGRFYQNTTELVEKGLVETSELDGRTNQYELTHAGRVLVEDRRDWLDDQTGAECNGAGHTLGGPGHE